MKKILSLLIVCLLFTKLNLKAQTWNSLGPNDITNQTSFSGGNAQDIKILMSGSTPYVVYRDVNNNDKATVKKYDGSNWITVGSAGFSTGSINYIDIAFNGTLPYVVYGDNDNGGKVTVQKFNGTAWEIVGTAGFSAGIAYYSDIVIINNVPYVLFSDVNNGSKATVMKFNGTSWVTVGNAGFTNTITDYMNLESDGSNPYVAYSDLSNSQFATVRKFDGTSWSLVGSAGFSVASVSYLSMAINGNDIYVVFSDANNSNKATVRKFNGTSWSLLGTAGFSAGRVFYNDIVTIGNTPYVIYKDNANSDKSTVQKFNGTNWELVGTVGFSAGSANYTSIASDGNDLFVAYSTSGAFVKKFTLTTLPVQITTFEATIKNQKQVVLNWQTASENKNSYFTISKSEDGKTFEQLTTVKSKGNQGANYETIDFSPFNGTNYYKLSQTDLDGIMEELGIRTVKLASLTTESLSVYPNPIVNGIINIKNLKLNGLQIIEIYDMEGKKMVSDKINFNNGLASFKIKQSLIKGIYLLNIGDSSKREKIIIE